MVRLRLSLTFAIALVATRASAHDQWLETAAAGPVPGATVEARLFVGEAPVAEEQKPFERTKLARLELWSRNGRTDLLAGGTEGSQPLARASGLGEGEFLIALDRAPVLIQLEPAKFEAYLASEGLGAIVKERQGRGEAAKPGRERYTRYVKALAYVGAPRAQGMSGKVVGQRLELTVDRAEPLRADSTFVVRVTFDGKPLAGARVEASLRAAEPTSSAGTTDARGGVSLRVATAGLVVIHLVHMRRCLEPGGTPCREADWESFWGSFTTVVL